MRKKSNIFILFIIFILLDKFIFSIDIKKYSSAKQNMAFIKGGYLKVNGNRKYKILDMLGISYDTKIETHEVYIKIEDMYVDKYETTNDDYAFFLNHNFHRYYNEDLDLIFQDYAYLPKYKTRNRPVNFVNYYDAKKYCEFRGKKLLNEYEWEWAARKNKNIDYTWGNHYPTEYYANVREYNSHLVNVGEYEENINGLYDMIGNVAEWTESFDHYKKGFTDPTIFKDKKREPIYFKEFDFFTETKDNFYIKDSFDYRVLRKLKNQENFKIEKKVKDYYIKIHKDVISKYVKIYEIPNKKIEKKKIRIIIDNKMLDKLKKSGKVITKGGSYLDLDEDSFKIYNYKSYYPMERQKDIGIRCMQYKKYENKIIHW